MKHEQLKKELLTILDEAKVALDTGSVDEAKVIIEKAVGLIDDEFPAD